MYVYTLHIHVYYTAQYIYIYIYIYIHIHIYTYHIHILPGEERPKGVGWAARRAEACRGNSPSSCRSLLRPVRLLRVWISEGLTQADS